MPQPLLLPVRLAECTKPKNVLTGLLEKSRLNTVASAPGTGHKNIKKTQTLSGLEKSLRFSFGVIERLRMKIEDTPSDPQMLLTVRRIGYKWNVVG